MTPGIIDRIDTDAPVLIAGPTASGKSALALAVARAQGGVVVNADALQVHDAWRVLTARPSPADEAAAPHALYGHIRWGRPYAVGDWLREVGSLLASGARPIVVGGTGLYFRALTEGLADIPPVPAEVTAEARDRLAAGGLDRLVGDLSDDVRSDMDLANPARVLRAWSVQRATGRSIRAWQADTPAPLLGLDVCTPLLLDAPRDWLAARIERRFDAMLASGALDEARANLSRWDPAAGAAKAIGAPELIAHLRGEMTLSEARTRSVTATRRYAKRQRTWFRARMRQWRRIVADDGRLPFDNDVLPGAARP